MEYVLLKDLRFFDYPGGTVLFRETLDRIKLEMMNYIFRAFKNRKFVFINLFSDEVNPFSAERFIMEFIPTGSVILDEIVEYLGLPVEREFDVSFPDFTTSPLADPCECLLYDEGKGFERVDLSQYKVNLFEKEIYDELNLADIPENSLVLLKGILWDSEYKRFQDRQNFQFVGKVLKKKNWPKLDTFLLEEIQVGEEL
ncbi:hypothetical protein [Thermotoga sp. KOL6]|uniref:hypothetical protein n=1 Tax=Thermotoga sp. KOL6 TaxID=126741 RepID=UPI000C77A8E6|nr:hypothetical protein [Thermotoga sp. KOL6]PLV59255.1 hypothetical protein AS005_05810 [Thermotoga sp. KOL6]